MQKVIKATTQVFFDTEINDEIGKTDKRSEDCFCFCIIRGPEMEPREKYIVKFV